MSSRLTKGPVLTDARSDHIEKEIADAGGRLVGPGSTYINGKRGQTRGMDKGEGETVLDYSL